MRFTIKCGPRVPWNVFDQVCSFGLEVSVIFYCNMHAAFFYRNMHIVTCDMGAICILRCNMDSFLLYQKGLEEV
jgi:hypothetical protein